MITEFFIALGVFPVELLAYQVSVAYAVNIDQDSSFYIHVLDITLG